MIESAENPESSIEAAMVGMERRFEEKFTGSFGDPQRAPLWHYTDGAGLLGILQSKLIWATHYRFTNDFTEIRAGEEAIQRAAEAARDAASGIRRAVFDEFLSTHTGMSLTKVAPIYIASFSESTKGSDELIHWRSYGAQGSGYAIVLNRFPVPEAADAEARLAGMLVRCVYDRTEFERLAQQQLTVIAEIGVQMIEEKAAGWMHAQGSTVLWLLRQAAALTPRLKDRAFESEQEWRFVAAPVGQEGPGHPGLAAKFRNTDRGIIPYVEVPLHPPGATNDVALAKIVVGPALDQARRVEAARLLLLKQGYPDVPVEASPIPFRG